MRHQVAYLLGLTSPNQPPYLWWSGFGGRVSLGAGFLVVYLRRHNCHQPGCWRLQWRAHGETVLCRLHHPAHPKGQR